MFCLSFQTHSYLPFSSPVEEGWWPFWAALTGFPALLASRTVQPMGGVLTGEHGAKEEDDWSVSWFLPCQAGWLSLSFFCFSFIFLGNSFLGYWKLVWYKKKGSWIREEKMKSFYLERKKKLNFKLKAPKVLMNADRIPATLGMWNQNLLKHRPTEPPCVSWTVNHQTSPKPWMRLLGTSPAPSLASWTPGELHQALSLSPPVFIRLF